MDDAPHQCPLFSDATADVDKIRVGKDYADERRWSDTAGTVLNFGSEQPTNSVGFEAMRFIWELRLLLYYDLYVALVFSIGRVRQPPNGHRQALNVGIVPNVAALCDAHWNSDLICSCRKL